MIVVSRTERCGVHRRVCDTNVGGGREGWRVSGGCWLTVLSQQTPVRTSSVNWSSRRSAASPPGSPSVHTLTFCSYSFCNWEPLFSPVDGPESLERVSGALWDAVG